MVATLPSRIRGYLQILAKRYAAEEPVLAVMLTGSKVRVEAGTEFDNLDGGQNGHDVIIYSPLDLMSSIELSSMPPLRDRVARDLNILAAGCRGEFVARVSFEVDDELDPASEQATRITFKPLVDAGRLSIWREGYFRVFISHRDNHKNMAKQLADKLESYGCSCFVAHETIPANEEWRKTIVAGLETMEVMLVFLTDDFQDSVWTMQEIGYALGRGVPHVALKLGRKDPPGFISHMQALRGSLESAQESAHELFRLMLDLSGKQARLYHTLIQSFLESPTFDTTIVRFNQLNRLIDDLIPLEIDRIREGYRVNDQLHNCIYLNNSSRRLISFLNRVSRKRYTIEGVQIEEMSA